MANENSFGSVLRRILSGKPAFTPQTTHKADDHSEAEHGEASTDYFQALGHKVYPDVRVVKTEFHHSGDHAEVWVEIENLSHFDVELGTISAFGMTTQLNTRLQPHGGKQYRIYTGHVFSAEPRGWAELIYKLLGNGDYFMHPHQIMSRRESDGHWVIGELRAHPERINDI